MLICRRSIKKIIKAETVRFTSDTTWTSPFDGYIDIFVVNGGFGGRKGERELYSSGNGTYNEYIGGGSGGFGGRTKTFRGVHVTKGQTFNVVIGQGGTGESSTGSNVFGGQSSFGGYTVSVHENGYGGTAGGWGAGNVGASSTGAHSGYSGKTDGDGGQNSTTRAFGDADGELFSGGGGGGSAYSSSWGYYGYGNGGSGGGGRGGSNGVGLNGIANTGGGGGGGSGNDGQSYNGGNGGSGIVMIRWKKGAKQ